MNTPHVSSGTFAPAPGAAPLVRRSCSSSDPAIPCRAWSATFGNASRGERVGWAAATPGARVGGRGSGWFVRCSAAAPVSILSVRRPTQQARPATVAVRPSTAESYHGAWTL